VGATADLAVGSAILARLDDLASRTGSTLFMVLLAAYAIVLSDYADTSDVVIGSPIANRNRTEIEPLIGFFVNMLALRVDTRAAETFRGLLDVVRRLTLEASD